VEALSQRQSAIDAEVEARIAQGIAQAHRELEATLSRRQAILDPGVEARVAQGIAQARRELQDAFEERLMDRYRQLAPDLFPVDVRLGQSGTDACNVQGMVCVSMSLARRIRDVNRKFFGSSIPQCSAKVIRESSCSRDYQTDYALKGVVLRRSPEADAGVLDLSTADYFCLSSERGKQGIYQFANCLKP
jgi:hypothetical protein